MEAELGRTQAALEENEGHARVLADHLDSVRLEIRHTQARLGARTKEAASEAHARELAAREAGRLRADGAALQQRRGELAQRVAGLQTEAFQAGERLDQFRLLQSWNQVGAGLAVLGWRAGCCTAALCCRLKRCCLLLPEPALQPLTTSAGGAGAVGCGCGTEGAGQAGAGALQPPGATAGCSASWGRPGAGHAWWGVRAELHECAPQLRARGRCCSRQHLCRHSISVAVSPHALPPTHPPCRTRPK